MGATGLRAERNSMARSHYSRINPETLVAIIPISWAKELDFGNDEKAMRNYRKRLYEINKHNAVGWKFRTIRNGSILMVWRIA